MRIFALRFRCLTAALMMENPSLPSLTSVIIRWCEISIWKLKLERMLSRPTHQIWHLPALKKKNYLLLSGRWCEHLVHLKQFCWSLWENTKNAIVIFVKRNNIGSHFSSSVFLDHRPYPAIYSDVAFQVHEFVMELFPQSHFLFVLCNQFFIFVIDSFDTLHNL